MLILSKQTKLMYWPVQIAIVNRKSSKAIIPTRAYCSIYYHAIYQYHSVYHAFSTLPHHLATKWLLLNVYTKATCDQ